MPLATFPYDPAEDLTDPTAQKELLREAFASGDEKFIAVALGTVARARGMTDIANQTGKARQALYTALSEKGDPQLSTLLGVVKALGFRLSINPVPAPRKRAGAKG